VGLLTPLAQVQPIFGLHDCGVAAADRYPSLRLIS
jgi:hypothetical protein